MNIVILTKSEEPIYEQIYRQISSSILSGELISDYCLPSIRQLAKDLQVGVITVKKAYEILENDGFIYTVLGKGCFVKNLTDKKLEQKKLLIAKEKLEKGLPFFKELGISKNQLLSLIEKLY